MSDPEPMTIEEVRETDRQWKETQGDWWPLTAIARLCATVELFKRSAEWDSEQRDLANQQLAEAEANLKDCLEAQANQGLAHLRLAAERDHLHHALKVAVENLATAGYPHQNWGQFMALVADHFTPEAVDRWHKMRATGGVFGDLAAAAIKGREEIGRLRALTGRMREALDMAVPSVPENWTLRQTIAAILADPDGKQAAEELRLLREFEAARAAYLYGDACDAAAERHEKSWAALCAFRESQK